MLKSLITGLKLENFMSTLSAGILLLISSGCNQTPGSIKDNQSSEVAASGSLKERSEMISDSASLPKAGKSQVQIQLKGKWQREDGGYLLEVFSVSDDGKLDVGYLNPNPIHVETAEWKMIENKVFIRVILKDVNYPGSTYTLEYIQGNDILSGNYFQAVEGMNFDVKFMRKK